MKKLKIETLEVTSFATTLAGARERGTVRAQSGLVTVDEACQTTGNIEVCGDTNYVDCTFICG